MKIKSFSPVTLVQTSMLKEIIGLKMKLFIQFRNDWKLLLIMFPSFLSGGNPGGAADMEIPLDSPSLPLRGGMLGMETSVERGGFGYLAAHPHSQLSER